MSGRDTRVPVTVLTGFLGSGKTTLLNQILKRPDMEGAVVIVNEFGEVGLDHLLIEASEERFALLDNGCVCCTVRGDLVETLKDIERREAAGTLPPVKRVLIETTGLADPAPVLHSLMAEPALAACYRVGDVITTVDAVNGKATLERHAEAAKQVAVADWLLVTKADLANPVDVEMLECQLKLLSPAAQIAIAANGNTGCQEIFEDVASSDVRSGRLMTALARAEEASRCHGGNDCVSDCSDHHHGQDRHSHALHGIQSYSFVIEKPINLPAFMQWLDYIAMLKGEDLLRMKGIVSIEGESDRPVVVHGVQHVFHPPVRLDAWPSADKRTRLVFIVRGIPRQTIERTLTKFVAVDPASASASPRRTAA